MRVRKRPGSRRVSRASMSSSQQSRRARRCRPPPSWTRCTGASRRSNKVSGIRGWGTPRLLGWLGGQLPDNVYLVSLAHKPREGEALLVAESASAEALTAFLLRLEKEPRFAEVLLAKQGARARPGLPRCSSRSASGGKLENVDRRPALRGAPAAGARRRWTAVAGGGAMLVALGFWWPAHREAASLEERIALQRRALPMPATDTSSQPPTRRRAGTWRRSRRSCALARPSRSCVASFARLAREHGIIVSETYEETRGAQAALSTELSVQGDYPALRDFLRALSALPLERGAGGASRQRARRGRAARADSHRHLPPRRRPARKSRREAALRSSGRGDRAARRPNLWRWAPSGSPGRERAGIEGRGIRAEDLQLRVGLATTEPARGGRDLFRMRLPPPPPAPPKPFETKAEEPPRGRRRRRRSRSPRRPRARSSPSSSWSAWCFAASGARRSSSRAASSTWCRLAARSASAFRSNRYARRAYN